MMKGKLILVVVAGGDKIDNKLKQEVLEFFGRHNNSHVQFLVGYGCTELGGSTIVQLFDTGSTTEEKNIGLPLPVLELKIVDDDKNELVNGEKQGELLIGIKGIDNIGYANDENMTKKVFEKTGDITWYNTEDVVSFSDTMPGTIDFVSRNKRFIMITEDDRSGKVIPDDVELQIISNVNEVQLCCVVGIDEDNVTKLKAAVKLRDNVEVTDELIERIKAAACKKDVIAKIDEIVFVDSLPLTDRQKVKYLEIEKMFEERKNTKKLELK